MDILNRLFAANGEEPTPATPAAPAPSLPTGYADLYSRLMAATNARIDAQAPLSGRGLFNLLTGRDRAAATADLAVTAPAAWQAFQDAQSKMQQGQLGTAQSIAATSAMTGVPIDPNNIPAAATDMAKAYGGVFGGQGVGGGSAPLVRSAPGEPQPVADPLQQQRSLYMRLGKFSQMLGNSAGAAEYFRLANAGLPDGTALLPDGRPADGISGAPLTTDVGTLAATRAGKVSRAEMIPRVQGDMTMADHRAGLERDTHRINADVDASRDLVDGIDKRTGLPVTTTRADLLKDGTGNFANSNPYFAGQQDELKELRTKAETAGQGLELAQQISNAANGLYTGKGATAVQNLRQFALAAGELAGEKPDEKVINATSQFEQLKYASQQLVAVAVRQLGSREAQNIYNQIAAIKPGDRTSVRGLRDIINNQIVPTLMRSGAVYRGVSDYYKQNPLANDAMTVVPGRTPLSGFRVKTYPEKIFPGDFYISRHDGGLQRAETK